MGESIELYQWIRHHEPLYLTKRDLQHLNLGYTCEVALFDGNFEEYYICDNVPSNEIISPEQMFQENKITLTYTNDSPHSWDMEPVFLYGEIQNHTVNMDMRSPETTLGWYPLRNDNCVHITYHRQDCQIAPLSEELVKHYDEFNEGDCIGWDGPMILWSRLHDLPQVYWTR